MFNYYLSQIINSHIWSIIWSESKCKHILYSEKGRIHKNVLCILAISDFTIIFEHTWLDARSKLINSAGRLWSVVDITNSPRTSQNNISWPPPPCCPVTSYYFLSNLPLFHHTHKKRVDPNTVYLWQRSYFIWSPPFKNISIN